MTDLTNQSIGRYHILEQLGQGGMATVYKAYDTRLEREVAVKVIRKEAFPPEQLERIFKRFEREAKVLAHMVHPNIVKIYDTGEYSGSPFLVMEYLPGKTLKDQMNRPIDYRQAARLLAPIAQALHYAHQRGILHRDVKPSNILLMEDKTPILTDFGIAKLLEGEEGHTLTGTGIGVGTPEYMAPEQGLGKEVDGRADMYGLGVVLYEMVTGRKPYEAETPLAVLLKQVNDPLPRPKQFIPDLPDEVERVIFKALAKKPEDRYETMAVFAAALEGLVHVQPVSAPLPQPIEQKLKQGTPPPEPLPHQVHAQPAEPETVDMQAFQIDEKYTIRKGKQPRKLRPVYIGLGALFLIISVFLFFDKSKNEVPSSLVKSATSSTTVEPVETVTTMELTPTELPVKSTPTKTPVKGTPTVRPVQLTPTEMPLDNMWVPIKQYTLTGHTDRVSSVAFSPDGSTLASGSLNGEIILWDPKKGEMLHTLAGHTTGINSVTFSPDGSTLASGAWDTEIILWDVKSREILHTLTGHTGEINSLAFSPDGSTLASGAWDTEIIMWDVKSGKKVLRFAGHTSGIHSVAFSPDGSTLASGSYDSTVILWDATSGQKKQTLAGHIGSVYDVAFSPDGSTLASGSRDKTIILWDARSGEKLRTLTGHTVSVTSVAFSPDGSTLASGSLDNTVILWDVKSGQILHTLTGHKSSVFSVAFSPDGSTLASGSDDDTVRLWDAKSGEMLKTLTGHTSYVWSVAFSPDGSTLASGSDDNTVILWDASSGEMLHTITGHRLEVNSVAFSPDGSTLASGSTDWMVNLWDLKQ